MTKLVRLDLREEASSQRFHLAADEEGGTSFSVDSNCSRGVCRSIKLEQAVLSQALHGESKRRRHGVHFSPNEGLVLASFQNHTMNKEGQHASGTLS